MLRAHHPSDRPNIGRTGAPAPPCRGATATAPFLARCGRTSDRADGQVVVGAAAFAAPPGARPSATASVAPSARAPVRGQVEPVGADGAGGGLDDRVPVDQLDVVVQRVDHPELVVHAVPPGLELVVGQQEDERHVGQLLHDGVDAAPGRRSRSTASLWPRSTTATSWTSRRSPLQDARGLAASSDRGWRRWSATSRAARAAGGWCRSSSGPADSTIESPRMKTRSSARPGGCRRRPPAVRSTPGRRARRPPRRPRDPSRPARCRRGPRSDVGSGAAASVAAVEVDEPGCSSMRHRARPTRPTLEQRRPPAPRHRAARTASHAPLGHRASPPLGREHATSRATVLTTRTARRARDHAAVVRTARMRLLQTIRAPAASPK